MECVDLIHAHRKHIDRYQRLLKTRLSDVERFYVESRLSEEMAPPTLYARPRTARPTTRRLVRISPTVSWYGKILVIGALLVTFGWELVRLVITLLTLD
ncbi:hypothetical protein EOW77_0009245 [Bradyrhizobium yuanmingense]|uniref:hypothetical protein n=1 Tax=Bradyrhizobium yuanmingense TaxID=108015 RepID=UPI000FE3A7FA|nr:hypothetical protein [Bradyrhizobium yuanmingense]TGN89012.1 hypothetical protein EOW77_0009245 [Bradyrhizobium yuanmingense]